jgi:hypothetical protein
MVMALKGKKPREIPAVRPVSTDDQTLKSAEAHKRMI